MSKYYDFEKIGGYLERIALAMEKIAELDQPKEEPQEEVKKEEVEELVKEEVKEPQEALKEVKEEFLELAKDAIKIVHEEEKAEEALKIVEEKPEAEVIDVVKEETKVEPKKAPVKRGDSRHEIRKHRISPYRIKEQGKKAPSSGFRIKED